MSVAEQTETGDELRTQRPTFLCPVKPRRDPTVENTCVLCVFGKLISKWRGSRLRNYDTIHSNPRELSTLLLPTNLVNIISTQSRRCDAAKIPGIFDCNLEIPFPWTTVVLAVFRKCNRQT